VAFASNSPDKRILWSIVLINIPPLVIYITWHEYKIPRASNGCLLLRR
jgi:hypothetical protein